MKQAIIHNPVDRYISLGSFDPTGNALEYDHKVLNVAHKAELKAQFKAGKISQDKAVFGGWTSEYEAKIPEYLSALAKNGGKFKVAALGDNSDFSAIDKVVVLQEVLNTQFRIYSLPDAIRKVPTPDTVLKVDQATTFNAYSDINPGVSVDPNRQSYSRTSYTLPKDVAMFALTDEAQFRASHPLFSLHVENTARALRAAWNAKIATVLEGGTTTGGSNWDTFSSGLSSNSPLVDIEGVQTTIVSNGGRPYTAAMHPKVWAGLISNTFMKGAYNANQQPINSEARSETTLQDKIAQLTVFIDAGLTNTKATVYDMDQYAICADGPTVAYQTRDFYKDADVYKIEHFNNTQRIVTGKGRVLTSVHS